MNYKTLSIFLGVCVIVLLWIVIVSPKKQIGLQNNTGQLPGQEIIDDLSKSFPKEALVDAEATEGPPAIRTTTQGDSLVRIFLSKKSVNQLMSATEAAMKGADWFSEYKSENAASYVKGGARVSFSFTTKSEGTALLIEYNARIVPVDAQQ
ncbi:MAG: hypothetical protein HYX21_00050 [Candidatus Yanofskybacteria bacterium]|nr:hypothetical protein [Candidatus Yanofskybacteria bacterium]